MSNVRRFDGLMLILLCAASPGCQQGSSDASVEKNPSNGAKNANPGNPFPVTITDSTDRTVTIDEVPARIVSLSPTVTEILFAIGVGPRVVGVTEFANYPPEVANLPRIGGFSSETISIERIVGLQPDLVICAGSFHDRLRHALEEVDVAAVSINATRFEHVYANIMRCGKVTGNAVQAADLIRQLKARLAKLESRVAKIPQTKRARVFYQVWPSPLQTVGSDCFISELIGMAGGVNIFGDLQQEFPLVSPESVISRKPTVIVAPSDGDDQAAKQNMISTTGWSTLPAVKHDRIHFVDADLLSRAGPRIVHAVQALMEDFYPGRIENAARD